MSTSLVPIERIQSRIYLIRGEKVMLDRDLAELYGVPTKQLKQAVTRNIDRFPSDFSFVLSNEEFEILRSQFVTSSWGGERYAPRVFTEQGVAMLSTVLRSKQAVHINIMIMRAFVKLRETLASNKELARKLAELDGKQDRQFQYVLRLIDEMRTPVALPPKRKFGFETGRGESGKKTEGRKK